MGNLLSQEERPVTLEEAIQDLDAGFTSAEDGRIDLDETNEDGKTPLHVAAGKSPEYVVERLIEAGADVNARTTDAFGWTPLHEAAHHGRHEIVAQLVEAGADVDARARHGVTPLHRAALGPHATGASRVIQALVAAGADLEAENSLTGETPLAAVVMEVRGTSEAVGKLLELGARADATSARSEGLTLLQAAAMHGMTEIVELLAPNERTDLEARFQEDASTALHQALMMRNFRMSCALIKAGADLGAETGHGHTALAMIQHLDGLQSVAKVFNIHREDDDGDDKFEFEILH